MIGHSLQSCKNINNSSNTAEKVQPKPKSEVYVPIQPFPKVSKSKVKEAIKEKNLVSLDPETNGVVKYFMVFLDSHNNPDVANDPQINEPPKIYFTHNKFNDLDVMVEDIEDSDEIYLDKEFVDVIQLMDDNIDSIENSLVVNNDKFLQSSWDNLENNVEVEEDIDDSPDGNLTHFFTLVRAKKKRKKLKQACEYITR